MPSSGMWRQIHIVLTDLPPKRRLTQYTALHPKRRHYSWKIYLVEAHYIINMREFSSHGSVLWCSEMWFRVVWYVPSILIPVYRTTRNHISEYRNLYISIAFISVWILNIFWMTDRTVRSEDSCEWKEDFIKIMSIVKVVFMYFNFRTDFVIYTV
jgi:hypothetical protein